MEKTDRLGLPLLTAGQAQKEMTVNEALALLDLAVQPVVEDVGRNVPPIAPQPGQAWVIGTNPGEPWAGQAGKVAGWTAAGWKFFSVAIAGTVWSRADGCAVQRTASGWRTGELRGQTLNINGRQVVGAQAAFVGRPAGGATVDVEARAAIGAILARLETHGLLAGGG